MRILRTFLFTFFMAGSFFQAAAFACGTAVSIDNEQVRALISTIKSKDADELDQIFALETLMCAKRIAIRDMASRLALKSANPTLRAKMLFEILMQKQGIIIQLMPAEGLSEKQYAYINKHHSHAIRFTKFEREKGAIHFHNGVIDLSGQRVDLQWGRDLGTFALDKNGNLVGFYKSDEDKLKIPAMIQIF